jgi:hypothetical protein
MALRLRRGTNAERLAITPQEGELIYVTDYNTASVSPLWVGDGTTAGGIASDNLSDALSELVDVDTSGATDGQVLTWVNANNQWEPTTFSVVGSIDDLTDVDITSSAPANGETLVWNSSANKFEPGTLQVSYDGTPLADVQGSVFGDDSTLLVDGVNSLVTGNISSNNIKLGSSDTPDLTIRKTGDYVLFDTGLAGKASFLGERLLVGTENQSSLLKVTNVDSVTDYNLYLESYGDYVLGPQLFMGHSRAVGGQTLVDGDNLGNIYYAGHDGNSFVTASMITATVDGTVAQGQVPSRLRFWTTNAAGNLRQAMYIDPNGTLVVQYGTEHRNSTFDLRSASNAQTSRIAELKKSRGTLTAPAAIQGDDHLYTLRFTGYDGSAYQTAAQIRGEAATEIDFGANPGVVPGRLRIQTADNTGTVQTAMLVGPDQSVQFNGDINATRIFGDLRGSVALDDSTVVISAQDGTLLVGNVNIVGETGNTPATPGTVDSWLQVTVNGATKFIPLYD